MLKSCQRTARHDRQHECLGPGELRQSRQNIVYDLRFDRDEDDAGRLRQRIDEWDDIDALIGEERGYGRSRRGLLHDHLTRIETAGEQSFEDCSAHFPCARQ